MCMYVCFRSLDPLDIFKTDTQNYIIQMQWTFLIVAVWHQLSKVDGPQDHKVKPKQMERDSSNMSSNNVYRIYLKFIQTVN